MQKELILFWRQMKKIKILRPLNKFIFLFASSNFFNIVMDFMEVHIWHNDFAESRKYFKGERERIGLNVSVLSDKKSRKVYRNLLQYRMSHKRKYLKGIVDKNQYFDKELVIWKDSECMVDGGAFDGDTVFRFKRLAEKEKFKWSVIAFEPDSYNYNRLRKAVSADSVCSRQVSVYNMGTWDTRTELHFQDGMDDSSRISDNGGSVVPVDTIDHVLGDRRVTFIKMDVEGAELESLKGAENVIMRDHPRLAISIYHSDKDMVDIIDYIANKYPFYKLFVRHYTNFFADTLCYAIDPNLYEMRLANDVWL